MFRESFYCLYIKPINIQSIFATEWRCASAQPQINTLSGKKSREKFQSGKILVGEKFSHFAKNFVTTRVKLTGEKISRGKFQSLAQKISHFSPTFFSPQGITLKEIFRLGKLTNFNQVANIFPQRYTSLPEEVIPVLLFAFE